MATILDVANEAQVSSATVSRVLNGSYAVTEEKRQRVMQAIEKVGYQIPPRPQHVRSASDVANSERCVILVICSSFIEEILHSFQTLAIEKNYHMVAAHYESRDEFAHLEGLLESLSPCLAGIVLINCSDNSRDFQALLEPYPLVQIGEPIMEHSPNVVVYNDETRMGEDATNYLIEQGCRKIGILTAEPSASTSLFYKKRRLQGYFLAHMNHDLPTDSSLVEYTDVSIDGGYEGMKNLLARHPDLDGVVGTTNVMAQGAIYAIRRAGKTTEDIRVFSIDSNEVWDFTNHDLPYIDPHHDEMGATALHVLHATIRGEIQRDYRVVIRHTLQCMHRTHCASYI